MTATSTPSLVLVPVYKSKYESNTDGNLISRFYLLFVHIHVIKHLDYLGIAHKELTEKGA